MKAIVVALICVYGTLFTKDASYTLVKITLGIAVINFIAVVLHAWNFGIDISYAMRFKSDSWLINTNLAAAEISLLASVAMLIKVVVKDRNEKQGQNHE